MRLATCRSPACCRGCGRWLSVRRSDSAGVSARSSIRCRNRPARRVERDDLAQPCRRMRRSRSGIRPIGRAIAVCPAGCDRFAALFRCLAALIHQHGVSPMFATPREPCRRDPARCPEAARQCPQCWRRLDGRSATRLLGQVTTHSRTRRRRVPLRMRLRALYREALRPIFLGLMVLTTLVLSGILGWALALALVR